MSTTVQDVPVIFLSRIWPHDVVTITAVDAFGVLVAELVNSKCSDLIEVLFEASTENTRLELVPLVK